MADPPSNGRFHKLSNLGDPLVITALVLAASSCGLALAAFCMALVVMVHQTW